MRRIITRAIGLVPAMAVAIAVGRDGVDALLVASQVALSIVLPFIVFPLLLLTSSSSVMSVKKPRHLEDDNPDAKLSTTMSATTMSATPAALPDLEGAEDVVDYSNGRIAMTFGWLLWIVVVAANLYAIVSLGMGQG